MDKMPVGTILTLPSVFLNTDWVEYRAGMNLSIFPELKKILVNQETLPEDGSVKAGSVTLGSIAPSAKWKEWDKVILSQHKELSEVISSYLLSGSLPEESLALWKEAVAMGILPSLKGKFLCTGSPLSFVSGGDVEQLTLPAIELPLNGWLGRTPSAQTPQHGSTVYRDDAVTAKEEAEVALVAIPTKEFGYPYLPRMVRTGSKKVPTPDGFALKVFICTQTHDPSVPDGFRKYIKVKSS